MYYGCMNLEIKNGVMGSMTYTGLINATIDLYLKGDYREAYDCITENSKKVKGNEAQIYNFRYCIASKAGLHELAMDIMKEAVVKKGYWYSYSYLIEDEDLKPLNKYNEFYELANICRDRETKAKANSMPDIKILKPDNIMEHRKYPLLLALHGNEENILITEDYWEPCTINGYVLALPQSSQIGFSEAYFWNDVEKASEELSDHYNKIFSTCCIDSDNVVIGGFSAGARAALHAILNDRIKVKGFIFVGPWLPEIDEWEHLLDKLKTMGTKAYVICGERDSDCLEDTEKFVDMLEKRNVPNIFKVISELGHDYPDNFDEILKDALEFII